MTDRLSSGAAPPRPYRDAIDRFDPDEALAVLAGSAARGWNAAIECCDRHCGADRIALRCVAEDGSVRTFGFEELRERSIRLAAVFAGHGVGPGDRVAGLLPRSADLVATVLATWRLGAVYLPLFTAFGPKAIEYRLRVAGATLIVTDAANRGKLAGIDPPGRIAVAGGGVEPGSGDIDLEIADGGAGVEPVARSLDDPFLMMFTSGTTGQPKSLLVPIRALAAFVLYLRDAAGLTADDRFWNMADPGWAYGLYYGIAGPLALGHAILLDRAAFSPERSLELIRRFGITNLAGSPTAFRLMTTAPADAVSAVRGRLRAVSSAGEPLDPGLIAWFAGQLDAVIHDHYGQTELGMVAGNHHGLTHPVTPGTAGLPIPGHRLVVVDGQDREVATGEPGTLAVDKAKSPLFWFTGYREAERPSDPLYRTGDTVERHADGSIAFVGRADDVITSAGYRIGPFDVESAIAEHPDVLEAAVVGKPDPQRTEIVAAHIVLKAGRMPSDELADDIRQLVRRRLSAHAYPREITFVEQLPKTPSGKVQRFLLRAAYRRT